MLLPILTALALVSSGVQPDSVYDGRRNELRVAPPRVEGAEVDIDGALTEDVWKRAAVLTGFSEYSPVDGRPADDSTEVRVWYAPDAIYFGIRAHETHAPVQATLSDRDKITSDDYVQILLDTFHDGRRALVFGVNPLGIQSDGIRSEGGGNPGGGGDFSGLDLSPDFVWQSRGHVTSDGYEVEIRIPFRSLRYQAASVQDWGIQVVRQVQHSGHQQTWTPALKGAASFIAQSGTLVGLTGLHRGLVLDVNPVATERLTGGPAPGDVSDWRYDTPAPQLGGNVRWGVTSNLTLDGTINPDFSQVEADAGQLITDPRQALYFPEKRPFFLEGIQQFQTPGQLIYTRRIANPVAAAKLTGKVAGNDVGFISAVDEEGSDHPVFNLLRVRRDLNPAATVGLSYTDWANGGAFNRVAGADARIVFDKLYYMEFQGAASFTRDGTGQPVRAAPLWQATVDRTGRYFGFHYSLSGSHPDFVTQSGFLGRTGVAHAMIMNRFTWLGAPGGALENYTVFFNLEGFWEYDRFTAGTIPDEAQFGARNTFTLRGGWNAGLSLTLQNSLFPARLFDGYYLGSNTPGGEAFTPFSSVDRIPAYDVQLSLSTPQFPKFSGDASLTLGRDINYDEWAPAFLEQASLEANWRPTPKVRATASYLHQRYLRVDDRSTVRVRRVPRLKLEYQLSRPLFFRFVGQYDSSWRDALRDDSRTGRPLLVRTGDGVYVPSPVQSSNGLRADWLISFQPSPGTVIFAGYGSSLGADAFTLRDLDRTEDGFFFKVSYLFRM